MKQIVAWVSKNHNKLLINTFSKTHQLIFVKTLDELLLYKNGIFAVSLSKISNKDIVNNIKKIKSIHYIEKKGWITLNMTNALENSQHHFMVGTSDIQSIFI